MKGRRFRLSKRVITVLCILITCAETGEREDSDLYLSVVLTGEREDSDLYLSVVLWMV